MKPIMLMVGTRPELIKVAPVVLELRRRGLGDRINIVDSGQHADLMAPYWKEFGIEPDVELDLMVENQSLAAMTARALTKMDRLLVGQGRAAPRIMMAQGDTATVMAASIAAFYHRIAFVHLEAGLRTFDFANPFPEEFNRRVTAITTALHLAPTERARDYLVREGIEPGRIAVVGNTVIDAVEIIRLSDRHRNNEFVRLFRQRHAGKRIVLVTCHRRENHGAGLRNIVAAVKALADEFTDYVFIWTLHPNPNVRAAVNAAGFEDMPNIEVVPPLDYSDLLATMEAAALVISDSGGIQEEAPCFGVPVLVLRERTERPEGVDLGISQLVGSNFDAIVTAFRARRKHGRGVAANPYGDGRAAERVCALMAQLLQAVEAGTTLLPERALETNRFVFKHGEALKPPVPG